MDRLGGDFSSSEYSDGLSNEPEDDEIGPEAPPPSIGTDERRMQVRAYNHWASLLGERSFPSIEDLEPENQADFGPFSVLLDFSTGIEDPAVQFLGAELAGECGADHRIEKLSDVPSRSLLSRITDHYMQILANQAPIGFEAEFINQRDATILYRGILLPYSSDGETIDFIYGVINWKEMADQETADELLLEMEQSLDAGVVVEDLEEAIVPPPSDDMVASWADAPGGDAPLDLDTPLPEPQFGLAAFDGQDESVDDYEDSFNPDEWDDEPGEEDDTDTTDDSVVARLSSLISTREPRREGWTDGWDSNDSDAYALDDEESDDAEDNAEQNGDGSAPESNFGSLTESLSPLRPKAPRGPANMFELTASLSRGGDGVLREAYDHYADDEDEADEAEGESQVETEALAPAKAPDADAGTKAPSEKPVETDPAPAGTPEEACGLYDHLAEARELALAARDAEGRSRNALYAAVSRAHDVALAAEQDPDDYAELLAENGLEVQERAPFTPVVKLVFGADYEKTRIAEYATVLAHAKREAVDFGGLEDFIRSAEGGIKGIVDAERRLRKEESGKAIAPRDSIRPALAKRLRKVETAGLDTLASDGPEFGVVMIRRLETGEIVLVGEVSEDIALVEKVGRTLLG